MLEEVCFINLLPKSDILQVYIAQQYTAGIKNVLGQYFVNISSIRSYIAEQYSAAIKNVGNISNMRPYIAEQYPSAIKNVEQVYCKYNQHAAVY